MANTRKKIDKKHLKKWIILLVIFLTSLLSYFLFHPADVDVRAQGTARVKIDANGTIMVNGKAFFPFGFYYVSLQSTADKQMNALRDIGAAGFNTIHASVDARLDDHEKLLDEAKRLGVHVMSDHEASWDRSETIKAFKNKPALLSWSIGDDVSSNHTPEELLKLHKEVKAIDPNHLTYTSMFDSTPKVATRYIHCSDIVGMQNYPISNKPLNSTYYEIKAVVDIANGSPVLANLQAFKWAKPELFTHPQREPTFKEIRNMTYQALLAGAKGIIYYTYRDQVWYLPAHPDLWKGLQSLVPEMKELSPLVLNGDLIKIYPEGKEDIFAGIWRYKTKNIAVVINTSEDSTRKVSIELPTEIVGEAQSIFSGRPSGMVVKDGKLSGSVKPLDVHVYRLSS